jgi:hypothetical protein
MLRVNSCVDRYSVHKQDKTNQNKTKQKNALNVAEKPNPVYINRDKLKCQRMGEGRG